MFGNPSLITRIAVGKAAGLVIGLAGFIAIPYIWADADPLFRWGILLWYTTLGALIGIFGVMTWHPVLKLPMPWWFRASWLGAWMNFVLAFFAYDALAVFMASMFGAEGVLASPFWFVLEGAVAGLVIGFLATRYGGEGKETVSVRE